MHLIQTVQEQHAIYFGYAFFRRFRLILQESKRVKLKPSKCHLACASVWVTVSPAPELSLTRQTLRKLGRCPFQHLPRRLGLSYVYFRIYRRFIRNFAHTAEPLHRLRHKGVPFTWSAQASESFHILKEALTSPSIMAFLNLSIPFLLYTDASLHWMVRSMLLHTPATCCQRRKGNGPPLIANYSPLCGRCTISVHYLACYPFTIITDHKPLIGLRKLPLDHDPTGRCARWPV